MTFKVLFGRDPTRYTLESRVRSHKDAAAAARRSADFGEIITVIGPRGGETEWRAIGHPGVYDEFDTRTVTLVGRKRSK